MAGGGYNSAGQMSGAYNTSPQQGTPTGSFIPPTPYSAGYTSPGYQPMNASMQGYPPYGQMGRNQPGYQQPDFSQQIPLNGGGYVPPKVSVRRSGFQLKPLYLILAGGLLLILFGLGLLLPSAALKIVFLLLTIGSTVFLWIVRSLTTDNRRLCYTIISAVLCLAVVISFIPWKSTTQTDNRNPDSGNNGNPVQTDSSKVSGVTGETVTAKPASPETTDTPEPEDNYLLERLYTFFKYWSGNRQDEMLGLCAPSWQNKQENPRTALFTILANRKPIDMSMESITGTSADLSRKVILVTTLDRNNLKPAEKYRMTILMVKENNDWYIMPESLATFDSVDTPDPNVTPTVSPTPTAAIYSNTVLYFNPNGGEYYHFDPYCINVKKSLTPLAGQFYYSQVDDPPYDKLKPCNVCGAPLRPGGP